MSVVVFNEVLHACAWYGSVRVGCLEFEMGSRLMGEVRVLT